MKKIIILILAFLVCLSLFACSSEHETLPTTEPSTTPPTAYEQLSDQEKILFEALVKMASDFYEPAALRLLEVGDLDRRAHYDREAYNYGPDTIVVRLQGENTLGGTLSHYYKVCIVAADPVSENAKEAARLSKSLGHMENYLKYKGEVGEHAELSDYYTIEKDESITYNIGRINKALSEYWGDMGF